MTHNDDTHYQQQQNNTERRMCGDCVHFDRCECDSNDLQPCRFYISDFSITYDYDKDNREYHWQEMSYHRYTENILSWNYCEYSDDHDM